MLADDVQQTTLFNLLLNDEVDAFLLYGNMFFFFFFFFFLKNSRTFSSSVLTCAMTSSILMTPHDKGP